MVKPIPEGFGTVTAHLVVKGAAQALEFYEKAFGAETMMVMPMPGGGVMHAEIRIGDTMIMVADEMPQMERWVSPSRLNGTTVALSIYSDDCDALFERAVAAGATVSMPVMDMFWGDRYGKVTDPFGHEWELATHKEDLTPEQVGERAKAFFEQMSEGGPC